jgi:uncharacterized protein (DUF983 family)
MKKKLINNLLESIETVSGVCPGCQEDTILIAIVTDFYRCTNCGFDVKQYVNGSIKYLKLNEEDAKWLKRNSQSEV